MGNAANTMHHKNYTNLQKPTEAFRLTSHWPANTPDVKPLAKRPIFVAQETSPQMTTDKATAIAKNMIDRPINALVDLYMDSPALN